MAKVMTKAMLLLSAISLLAAPLVYAHDGGGGVAGTPDPGCERGTDWADHDYGPPATGSVPQGLRDGNLDDCDGDFNEFGLTCWNEEIAREDVDGDTQVCERFDHDGHSEFATGGAWLLVDSGDGVAGGSLLCYGEAGHHPAFGPFFVSDLVWGAVVDFTVESDLVDASGLGDPCGDFQSDASALCGWDCVVPFPPGLDGSYRVSVGPDFPGTRGHVCTAGGDCVLSSGVGPLTCRVDLGTCEGACYVNTGNCQAQCAVNTSECHGRCVVNAALCEGQCRVNSGICSTGCRSAVNVGRC